MITEVVALPVGLESNMYGTTGHLVPPMSIALPSSRRFPRMRVMVLPVILLVLAGCGGGDFPVDAPATEAPAVSGASVTQATALDGAATTATLAAASASASSAEPSVVIRRQPLGVEVREGSIAQFSVDAEGSRSVTYQWLRDDEVIEGETGTILKLTVTPADHLARISVIIRAGRTTLQSDSALLRVSQA